MGKRPFIGTKLSATKINMFVLAFALDNKKPIKRSSFLNSADMRSVPSYFLVHPDNRLLSYNDLEEYYSSKLPSGKRVYILKWLNDYYLFADDYSELEELKVYFNVRSKKKKGSRGKMKDVAIYAIDDLLPDLLKYSSTITVPINNMLSYEMGFRKRHYDYQKDKQGLLRDIKKKNTSKYDPEILLEAILAHYRDKGEVKESLFPSNKNIVLLSGGLDSVALSIILFNRSKKGQKYMRDNYIPVFMSHRSNVGNVTKKEIETAHEVARRFFGQPLMVFKPKSKSKKLPEWYGDRVFETEFLPVSLKKKTERNRRFLKVLNSVGLANNDIILGVLGIPGAGDRSRAAGRAEDVTKKGLQDYLKSMKAKGKIKVVKDFGFETKVDMLREITSKQDRSFIDNSESCLMFFNQPCGDCWSCEERYESMMGAYGEDRTRPPYRPNSKVGRRIINNNCLIDSGIDCADLPTHGNMRIDFCDWLVDTKNAFSESDIIDILYATKGDYKYKNTKRTKVKEGLPVGILLNHRVFLHPEISFIDGR